MARGIVLARVEMVNEHLPYNDFFEKLSFENEDLAKGRILISEPWLPDPNFSRTVILITAQNEEGSVGLTLNKPSDLMLSDLIEYSFGDQFPIYLGGPVERESLFFLHSMGEELKGATQIMGNLYWGGDFEQLQFMMKNQLVTPSDVKFFMGYAGWASGQLEYELEERSWLVKKLNSLNPLSPLDRDSWVSVLGSYGKKYQLLASFPENPSLN